MPKKAPKTKKVKYTGPKKEVVNALSGIWQHGEVKTLSAETADELVAKSYVHEFAKGVTTDGS